MRARLKVAAVALVLLLARATAAADPVPQHVHTDEPRLLCIPPAPPATCIELQPGEFVDASTWSRLDVVLKTAQNDRTRLTAENTSLRASAAGWQPGWKTLGLAVLSGVSLGWYLHSKI